MVHFTVTGEMVLEHSELYQELGAQQGQLNETLANARLMLS